MNPHNQYVDDPLDLPSPVPTSSIPSAPSSSSTAHTHVNNHNAYVPPSDEAAYALPSSLPTTSPSQKWTETAPTFSSGAEKPKKSRTAMYLVAIGVAVVIIVVLAVLLVVKPWEQQGSGNGNGSAASSSPAASTSSPTDQRSCRRSDFTTSLDTCIAGSIYQCSANNVYTYRGSCKDVVGFTIDRYFGGESPFAPGCVEGVTGYIVGNNGGHPCVCKDKFKGVGNCEGTIAHICASDGTYSHQVCNTLNGGGCSVSGGQAGCT
ncbi:hypothetical protein BJ742DRAFT_800959 [Cladochytrium replicatum]|nr:hypothetical protein BJ742DRAFT_800959 [Cladochytrium replicatum]